MSGLPNQSLSPDKSPPSSLKKLSQRVCLPIHDDQLFTGSWLPMGIGNTVLDIQSHHVKTVKHPPNVRMIVDGQHHFSLAGTHDFGHLFVLFKAELDAITLGLPVRRVQVEEAVGAVVALHAVLPRQIFDVGAAQPQAGGAQVFLYAAQVDRWAGGGGTERLAGDFAAEGVLLQIKEPGGTLDVGQRLRPGGLLPLEYLAAADRPLELAHELFHVVLD